MSTIIRPIHAQVGDVVRIFWRNAAGEVLTDERTAPPDATWTARHRSTIEASAAAARRDRDNGTDAT